RRDGGPGSGHVRRPGGGNGQRRFHPRQSAASLYARADRLHTGAWQGGGTRGTHAAARRDSRHRAAAASARPRLRLRRPLSAGFRPLPHRKPDHRGPLPQSRLLCRGTGGDVTEEAILDVRGLSVRFAMPRRSLFGERPYLHAVRDVSFTLKPGRTLGLVGESGSGKTTTAMAAIRLVAAHAGTVMFEGSDLFKLDPEAMREHRRHLQVIFQDPYSSLNPRERVGTIVREPLDLMAPETSKADRESRVRELFGLVGLRPDQIALFPHQFSGGQRQRISIARALATHPRLIICDEPVS